MSTLSSSIMRRYRRIGRLFRRSILGGGGGGGGAHCRPSLGSTVASGDGDVSVRRALGPMGGPADMPRARVTLEAEANSLYQPRRQRRLRRRYLPPPTATTNQAFSVISHLFVLTLDYMYSDKLYT